MNMKFTLPLLLVLAGCADTTETLLTQEPELTATLAETPAQVRDCITSKHPGKFRVTPMGQGWLVDYAIMGQEDAAAFATTITPQGDHSLVKSYRHKNVFGAQDYYTDSVVACTK